MGAIARGGYGYYSDNIDDLKTAGCYLCVDISGGTVPTGSEWFTMFVIVGGTGSCIQIASGAVSAGLWIRHYDGRAWSTWKRMAATDDLANYLPLSGGTMTGALGVNNNLAILSGYTDSASTLAQLQAVKDNLNSALLQLERPLDDKTWPNVALYQRVNGGDYTLIGSIIHTGNIENYAAKIATGTYTGDGNASMSITLPFTPKAVYVCPSHGGTLWIPEGSGNGTTYTYGVLAVTGQNAVTWRGGHDVVAIQTGGFTAYYAHYSNEFMYAAANMNGQKYNYIAFG